VVDSLESLVINSGCEEAVETIGGAVRGKADTSKSANAGHGEGPSYPFRHYKHWAGVVVIGAQ
jgi:hypothetical protein